MRRFMFANGRVGTRGGDGSDGRDEVGRANERSCSCGHVRKVVFEVGNFGSGSLIEIV